MKRLFLTGAAIALGLIGAAQAHTTLKSAVPANNSVVTAPVSEIKLNFARPARLTELTIFTAPDKASRNLVAKIETLPKDAATAFAVPIEPLAPGKYTVVWRAMGGDSHVMSGEVAFTVNAK